MVKKQIGTGKQVGYTYKGQIARIDPESGFVTTRENPYALVVGDGDDQRAVTIKDLTPLYDTWIPVESSNGITQYLQQGVTAGEDGQSKFINDATGQDYSRIPGFGSSWGFINRPGQGFRAEKVSQGGLGRFFEAALNPTNIMNIGLSAIGGPAAVAAFSAIQGKDPVEIAKSAAMSYLGGEIASGVSGRLGDVLGQTGANLAGQIAAAEILSGGKADISKILANAAIKGGTRALTNTGPSSSDMIEGYFAPGGEGYVAPDNQIINTNPFLADTSDYSNEGRNYLSSDLTQGPGGSPLNLFMDEGPSPLTQIATNYAVDTIPTPTPAEAAMDDNSYNDFLTSIGIDPSSVSDFSNADSPSNADILQGINYFDDAIAADNIDVGGGWNPVTGTGDAATAEAASQTGVTSSSTLPFGGLTDADVAKLIGTFGGSAGATGAGALDKIKSLLGNKSRANGLLSLTGLVGGLGAFKDLLNSGNAPATVPAPAAPPRDERALPQWDWNAINAQAAQQGLQPGQFIARNMPQAMAGAYNQPQTPGFAQGGGVLSALAKGGGSGRDDTIHAKLSDGEYVMDAETVSLLGDGSTTAGAHKLDEMRAKIREHKGKSMATGRFSSNAKSPLTYLKEVS